MGLPFFKALISALKVFGSELLGRCSKDAHAHMPSYLF